MELEKLYTKFRNSSEVCSDTRRLKKDCIYFALKGDNFDGNNFVKQALERGAKYCIVDSKKAVLNENCFLVDDVLTTLQNLATHHRHTIKIPIIGLTGSNGKTTTKELIHAVLSTTYKVGATKGNLNNHIGVPLTLLSFNSDLDFGIVEMGANHQKEIEFLSNISQPDYGLITNFGKAHLEGFGGVEGVIKGKSELYDYIRSDEKTAFINADDPKQVKQIGNYKKVVVFGSDESNDCKVVFESANPFVSVTYDGITINSQLIGNYNYGNIAVAIAIGKHFNVSTLNIKKGVESYQPDNNRSEILQKNSNRIILDAYNANPTSMLAALENLNQLPTNNKVLFIGDMFELGKEAKKEHQAIVDYIESNFGNNIFLVGENFYECKTKTATNTFKTFEDLKPNLINLKFENATILIKGSRGMALERLLECL